MVLAGLLILGIGMIFFSFIDSLLGFYGSFLVIFLGAGFASFIPMMSALNNWFSRHRTTAISLGMTGATIGGVVVPLIALMVESFGWRDAARILGVMFLVLSVPLSLAIRNRPEDYGQLPDGDNPDTFTGSSTNDTDSTLNSEITGFTLTQAIRTRAFWTISIAHGLGATVFVTMSIHIVPALTDIGLSLSTAGVVVAILSVAAAASQVVGGFAGDRLPKRPLIFVALLIQGSSLIFGAIANTFIKASIFAVIFGIGQGLRVPLLVSIRGDYFGRKYFATILGASQLPMNVLMVGFPVLVGYMFDQIGNYFLSFLLLSCLSYLSAVLILLAKKPELLPHHNQGPSKQL